MRQVEKDNNIDSQMFALFTLKKILSGEGETAGHQSSYVQPSLQRSHKRKEYDTIFGRIRKGCLQPVQHNQGHWQEASIDAGMEQHYNKGSFGGIGIPSVYFVR